MNSTLIEVSIFSKKFEKVCIKLIIYDLIYFYEKVIYFNIF